MTGAMENQTTPLGQKLKPDFVSSFAAEFDREIMISDRKRAFLICGLSLFAVLWFNVIVLFFSDTFPVLALNTVYHKSMVAWFTMGFAGLAGYESIYALGLTIFLRRKKTFPIIPRFGNALVEISIPTIMVFFSFKIFASEQSLVTPIIFLYFLFISLSALRLMFTISLFTGIVAGAQYFWISLYVIQHSAHHADYLVYFNPGMLISRSVLIAMVGLVTGIVSLEIKKRISRSLRTMAEKNQIINIFGQHVPPIVVEQLIRQKGELGSETRFVCVMFLDIRNFTPFAESNAPEAVIHYLNALFDFMVAIVNEKGGIINKFLGDGFMAAFGAPISDGADCRQAVEAAMQILARLREEIGAGRILETRIGIGIHAGMAVTGPVGASQRKEYAIIGDVVNLAARIEQLNKTYHSQILISEAVWKAIEGSDYNGEDLGLIDIQGHAGAIRLYRLA